MVIYLIDVVMADFIVSKFRMRGDTTHNTNRLTLHTVCAVIFRVPASYFMKLAKYNTVLQTHTNSTKSFTFSFKTSMKAFSHKIFQMRVSRNEKSKFLGILAA